MTMPSSTLGRPYTRRLKLSTERSLHCYCSTRVFNRRRRVCRKRSTQAAASRRGSTRPSRTGDNPDDDFSLLAPAPRGMGTPVEQILAQGSAPDQATGVSSACDSDPRINDSNLGSLLPDID